MVVDVDTTEFVTLAEVKAHLNITGSGSDVELETMRSAAERHVETIVGPVLWREVTQSATGPTVTLNTGPVVSVDAVTDVYDSAVTGYVTYLTEGILTDLPAVRLTVTYTVGHVECTDDVRLATLIIAKHLWETQRGNSPAVRSALPGAESEPSAAAGYLIPHRAAALLQPHQSWAGIA